MAAQCKAGPSQLCTCKFVSPIGALADLHGYADNEQVAPADHGGGPTCSSLEVTAVTCLQVLVPTSQFLRSLVAARLAADVLDVPTVLIARTDAHSAQLLTSDVDERDRPFCNGQRTPEGFFVFNGGIEVQLSLCEGCCKECHKP